MAESKRRGRKTTQLQMELIVDFLRSHPVFLTGKCHPSKPNELTEKWEELAQKLNFEPGGANKTAKQWRTFVSEWKSRVRKKARNFKKNLTRTGGGGYIHRDLSELENRLMGAIGWIAITGNEELPQEIDPDDQEVDEFPVEIVSPPQAFLSDQFSASLFVEEHPDEVKNVFERENTEPLYTENKEPEVKNVFERENRERQKRPSRLGCRTRVTNKTALQKSAELYSNSAAEMSLAVNKLSDSITLLASALNNFANAITNKQN